MAAVQAVNATKSSIANGKHSLSSDEEDAPLVSYLDKTA